MSGLKLVEPLEHNPQTQPITVALKNICRDYPAGGGVLRELLQNADDAGASSVRFVLDQTSYPTATLVDPELADYQGPSLLAYNDSIFSDKDFDSLSRIGDSRKLQDGTTTGRFGRGFNAVYNWTDSPSILSRDRLLILDPHHRWTKRFENPGGPKYDFVENAKCGAMDDQMAAFSAITTEFDRPFSGTIIRIPLRKSEQAKTSEICGREATFSEVALVLNTFSREFGHTGLLFMKNVSQITVVVGENPPINICISNGEQIKIRKSEINAKIRETILEGVGNFNSSFEVEIKSGIPGSERQYRFAIHHSIQNYPKDEDLASWSKDEALLPWVAVASEIGGSPGKTTGGSLFNVLPSQILIDQPIHIHSCFSMSPDRARLHKVGDGSNQYPLPGLWNQWLFDMLVPTAWTNLLIYLAQQYPNQPAFEIWPDYQKDKNAISYGIDEKVLGIVERNNYPIWYTDLGYVPLRSGLVSKDGGSPPLQTALNKAGVPVIYLAVDLLSRVETICEVVHLKPRTACEYLERGPEQLRMVGEIEKRVLLEYVLSDPEFREYGAVKLFPFEDGTYKAIDTQTAFIHRDDDEQLLFQFEKCRNIDRQKLSNCTFLVLQKGCSTSSLHSSLRQRSTYDLKTYCLQNHFKKFDVIEDVISVDKNGRTFILRIWDWIVARHYSMLEDNISCLWLLPLTDGRYRKIKPIDASFDTIYAAPGELGDFLRNFAKIAAASNKPIVQADRLSRSSLKILLDAMKRDSGLSIKSGDRIEDFMLWLGEIREVFDKATDNDRLTLHTLVALRLPTCEDPKTISNVLSSLKIFQRVVWIAENDDMVPCQTWVTLKGNSELVGLREINPVPDLGKVTFLNAKSDDVERLLSYFGLAKCPSALELLERFMVPFWEDKTMLKNWTISGKQKITESLLRDFYSLDRDSKKRISSSALIPVRRLDGASTNKFSMAKELIDPSNAKLRELFFEDEEVCPANWVLEEYCGILINCGLRTTVDTALVVQRVKSFAERSADVKETSERARRLLQSFPSWTTGPDDGETSALRELRWLPVTDLDGSRSFMNVRECRGQDDKLLVGYVLPLLDFEISQDWRNRLGWNQPIQTSTILNQLEHGIEKGDRKIIDAVLKSIKETVQVEGARKALMKLSCVLASHGQFVSVRKSFQTGCERLQPYFYSVDTGFWREHEALLKSLGVLEKPNLEDLLTIQSLLPSEDPLNGGDIPVAIEIIRLASIFPESDLSRFKILDETGRLRATADVVYDDCSWSTITGTFNYTHPDIPKSVISAFQIEALSARVEKRELGIEDTDEEYDRHVDEATEISDALSRYTVESTFKEFLANADDCKSATGLNWLLDKTQYPKDHLLTDELKCFQGPALLVHNDGVFTKEDLEGFRLVGRGSKMDDDSTIGKFGRGSQTMFHWTDVPMLLSGKFLLILDPLQQVLPRSSRIRGGKRERKRGVKIPLTRLRGAHRNQLAPFEGLWDFSKDLDYYDGTIFRFPLRLPGAQSKLLETSTLIDFEAACKCLDNFLEKEGRFSLLFLRRIQFMDFKIFGDKEPRWSIKSDKDWFFSGWTRCTITKRMNEKLIGTFKERWRVAIQDLEEDCFELPSYYKRRKKKPECGMAALVPEPELRQMPIFKAPPIPKYFSALPLPFSTELPIHIHATFLLNSDRKSMPIEDSMQEDGGKWNKWLLSFAIPRLYLDFLGDLGRETRWVPNSFLFWPQDCPPKGHLSKLVYTSFWRMLPDSSREIFPVTRQVRAAQLGERRPPELVKLDDAIFDFLPVEKSIALRDMLESQIPKLVKPPGKIRRELERDMVVESVTPKRLRKLFKEHGASQYLEEAENPMVLKSVLELIMPKLEEDFTDLHGCRVLRLADGTLGTLRLANMSEEASQYFVATKEELGLFGFALHCLVSQEPGKEFKKAIVDSKKFNITQLGLSDIGKLLKSQNFGNKTPTATMDTWLGKFWDYCCRIEASELDMKTSFSSSPDVRSYPIFKAVCNGISSYIEPERLDMLPAVIEPKALLQRDICNKFPGIYMFSRAYLPTIFKTTEISLATKASFTRFLTTISKLAEKETGGLEAYVKKSLGTSEIKVLQSLVVEYVHTDTLSDYNMKHLLRTLPIWPTVESTTWINASAAFVTGNRELLVPWMDKYHRFISNEIFMSNSSALKALGVIEVDGTGLLSAHILPNLPKELQPLDVSRYQSFIGAASRISSRGNILDKLRQSKLAPNMAKKLRTTNELFDHEDVVFKAAFRNEENEVFLLKELEQHRNFWIELGLRHRDLSNGQFVPEDYILCLKRMRDRLETCKGQASYPAAVADARIVLVPLTTASMALGRFSSLHWSTVANQATFPALMVLDNQPSHRQQTMAEVSTNMPLLHLSDIVGSQYMSVCWSQISFPSSEPTVTSFAQIASRGKPSTSVAWKHLAHMTESLGGLTEDTVKAFLSDIFDTYDYLQENWEDSRNSFAPFRRRNLWFNLEHTDTGLARKADLELSRGSLENLILESSCDAPNLKSVRQGLIRYQKLLRALGCKSIVYPSVETPQTNDHQLISASLSRLRAEGLLLDLTLEANGGSIQAHKVVMASASGFFALQFKKHWLNQDIIDLKVYSRSTLSIVVDFSYADFFDWKSMQLQDNDRDEVEVIASKLDDLLDLLDAANFFIMPALKAQVEKQILILPKLFIRESNVRGVLKRVSNANAAQVEEYCKKFYADNKEAVDLATEE